MAGFPTIKPQAPAANQPKTAAPKPAGAAAGQAAPLAAAQDEVPRVSGFRISAKRSGSIEDIAGALSGLSFLELAKEKDALAAVNVESRDINKNPYLFSVIRFKDNKIEVIYTHVPGMSPKKRRLEILRYFLNVLTLLEGKYKAEVPELYQLVESVLSSMQEYVNADYERLYSGYDNLKNEIVILQRKNKMLTETNNKLSRENYDIKAANDELVLRIKALEVYSDSVLAPKVQEWLASHGGEINISDFSKVHKVPEMRVEQILNKLVTEGYIEARK